MGTPGKRGEISGIDKRGPISFDSGKYVAGTELGPIVPRGTTSSLLPASQIEFYRFANLTEPRFSRDKRETIDR